MATWETFKLSELKLDQTNYRTGPVSTQRASILAIIEDQKTKLVNLAADILEVGLSPGEPIWVTRDTHTSGMYIVLEGNRRITALKLMENPALADGTEVEHAFKTLAEKFAENPRREVEARVFGSEEEAKPWRRRRHMTETSGVGVQGWKFMAKARADHDQGRKAPRFMIVHDLLQDDSDEWQEITEVLDSKWSTVDRVLNASTLPKILGVTINMKAKTVTFENGNVNAGKALLRRILAEIASPNFNFARIEKDTDRETFIRDFEAWAVKADPDANGSTATSGSSSGKTASKPGSGGSAAGTAGGSKANPTTAERKTLAPKRGPRVLEVGGVRLTSLYQECRKINLKGNENASALLLRVFLELSSEAYLVEKKVPLPAKFKGKKTDWADIGISLADKITSVADDLDPSKKGKKFQDTRLALNPSTPSPASITTLHGYFHNLHMKPDATNIRSAWDSWEIYLRELHSKL